jgi:hypothetical protein
MVACIREEGLEDCMPALARFYLPLLLACACNAMPSTLCPPVLFTQMRH